MSYEVRRDRSIRQLRTGNIFLAMTQIKIMRVRRIYGVRDVMGVVGSHEHEREIGHVRALFEASDILEYVVSVVRLALVSPLEKF